MTKPTKQSEVAISFTDKIQYIIDLFASRDAAEDFATFGYISNNAHITEDEYTLFVDRRYDFDEVVAYIKEYK